ncbi:MAG TPA: hypothetical protein PL010_16090, partial [Flavobacteriales bacterium]|nr:hypothetical protein [Flavobacteriales bacterium]
RKRSLNWFMPALVNMSVGSSLITMGALGTMVWPWRRNGRGTSGGSPGRSWYLEKEREGR